MKELIFVIFALLFAYNILAQEIVDEKFSPKEDFYKLNYLNGRNDGRGNTGIAGINDISSVYMNPAALVLDKKYQLNIQYLYKTMQNVDLDYPFGNISYELEQVFPTVYLGFGYKLSDNFQTGFVYSNPGSMKQTYTKGIETINGETVYNKFTIHSFGIPAVYRLNNFSFGIIADIKLYTVEFNGVTTINDPNGNLTLKTDLLNFNCQFGITHNPIKDLSIGLTLTPGFQKEVKYEGIRYVTETEKFYSNYPLKIGAGIQYTLLRNKLNLSADYNFEQHSKIQGYKDKHNVNIGVAYSAQKNLVLRFGFFTFLDNRNFDDPNISYYFEKGKYTQYFLTIGFTYKAKNIEISASILDSHISPGIIKVLHVNSSISYNF